MTNTQRGILIMIKAALTGKAPEPYQAPDAPSTAEPVSNAPHSLPNTLPPDFDLEAAYKEIRRHQITPLAYAGAVLCGVPKDHPVMQQMFRIYLQQMLHSENQTAAVNKIFATFDQHGIDYVPLKGTTLKKLYPKPEYRLMGDADILIKTDQYPAIEEIMESIDFTFIRESDHELIWRDSHLLVELHKHLIPSYNKDYYAYYNNGWQLTKPASSTDTRHTFKTPEDEFIFLFTHFAKHYRDGGIGCRQAIDLHVFLSHNPQMNQQYIMEVLTKLQLQDFYQNILQTLEVWFNESWPDDKTALITDYIFSSGSWGTVQAKMMANMIKAKQTTGSAHTSRIKDFIHRAFPSRESMTYLYPTLKNDPYLLPVYYGIRIIDTVFRRREVFNKKMEAYKASTDDSIKSFQDSLAYVGLGFKL